MHLLSLSKTKVLSIFILLAISLAGYAQAPNLINYQGVARNAVGNPLPNQTINLRLSVHNLSASGTVVYTETRPITTNLGGLFSVQIGSTGSSSTTGSIAGVNWLTGDKYLQVEIDPTSNNNYLNMGTVQLISVPYAFNAATAANALTVTTNANLTGVVTSTGNSTAIANGAITNAMLANGALANLSGTNTGDNSVNTLYSGLLTNATHTGDATGSNALKVVKINGTLMSGLPTGILKNTTATGIPSIAVASDFPTLNQNTSGTATNVTGTVAVANGGSGASSLSGYIIGNGTSPFSTISKIPVTDVTAAVQTVNGNTPDANGNVTLAFGNVTSGTTASRPLNAGTNGNIYVISGDAIAADNGRTYISDGVAWQEVTSNQTATDQRYVKLTGSTMVGDLTFPTGTKASMTDAPIASTDLVNKSYLDAKVSGNILGNAVNVTGTVAVANGGSGSNSLTGYIIGNGTSPFSTLQKIPVTDVTGAVQKVNGSLPGSDGNVTIAFGNVTTGNFASRPLNAGTNGNIYVISGDVVNKSYNGRTFISDGTGWQEVTSDQAATDARYVQLSGSTITAGGIGYGTGTSLAYSSAGISGQILSSNGAGAPTWITPSSGGIPYLGATAAVDLGAFDLKVNGLTVGQGSGYTFNNTAIGNGALLRNSVGMSNTAIGSSALASNTMGSSNTAIGSSALLRNNQGFYNTAIGNSALASNTIGKSNTAIGNGALLRNNEGSNNIAIGSSALATNTTGISNTAIGNDALLRNAIGENNTAIGNGALSKFMVGSQNTAIGNAADVGSDFLNNATAIGNSAIVSASNTIQLGNISVTNVKTSGTITAGAVTYPKTDGLANQVLSTNGSGSLTWTTPVATADAGTLNGTTLKSTVTGSSLTSVGTITSGVWSGTTIAIANGGTGATTKSAAFNALSPMTTSGDIIYGGASGTGTRLAKGTDAQVLTLAGGLPTWAAAGVSSVGSISGSSDVKGATISGSTITLTPADVSNGGIITTGAQTLTGIKSFPSQMAIGTAAAPVNSAALEVTSTTKGFLPPRVTAAQRNSIATPATGLMVYCSNCGSAGGEPQYYNGTAWVNMIGGAAALGPLAIGDAYQGGKVAYILVSSDPGYNAITPHGLIAATSDQSTGIMWYNGVFTTTGVTATAIGTGLANTNAIIASQGATSTSYAAGLARAYTGGGYNDWYLPSLDELGKLFINKDAIGGFAPNDYWSSSEETSLDAKKQNFNLGAIDKNTKWTLYYVRAIRSF